MSAPALTTAGEAAEAAAVGSHGSLGAALAEFQLAIPEVSKRDDADVKNDAGKHLYSYSYADLADVTRVVLPALAAVGLAWSCAPTVVDGAFVLHYRLIHADSGEVLDGLYPLGRPDGKAQARGSEITYARRYCLLAVTGVAPDDEDDDGHAAGRGDQPARTARRTQPTQENRAMDAVRRILQAPDLPAARKAAAWVEENRMVDAAVEAPASVRSMYHLDPDVAVTLGALASARIDHLESWAHAQDDGPGHGEPH